MTRERQGQFVFAGAVTLALVLYALSVPGGLPWNLSSSDAMMGTGPYYWRYLVALAGGHSVGLTCVAAALAAGLAGALLTRYIGWKLAASAALVWIFLPRVWDSAILGERSVCLMLAGVVLLFLANAAILSALAKTRRAMAEDTSRSALAANHPARLARINALAGWSALLLALLFAAFSYLRHDFTLGEPASAYARGVAEASAGRIVVLNGACDVQVMRELGRLPPNTNGLPWVSLRSDDANRTQLVSQVKAAFPGETNLWVAARISPATFVSLAVKKNPNAFYLMNGESTTRADWERRWAAFAPYLNSSDRFVPIARRLFACEGNALANRISSAPEAWPLYRRIREEVDPGNFSALVNMSELIRRGHAVAGEERKRINEELERFFKDPHKRLHARDIVRASGPIRTDPELIAKLEAEAKRRIALKVASGEERTIPEGLRSLVEWNNDMVQAMNGGDHAKAGRIARAILATPQGRDFIPANGVMGTICSMEGDYVASERFFQIATATTNRIPPVVLNDYADTLLKLGKLDEAEKWARRAVREAPPAFRLVRITLGEVLEAKRKRQAAEPPKERKKP